MGEERNMEQPGIIIRGIRLSKGYSQKEIYTGIVSKSFAISFEQGRVVLALFDFMQVLERLSLSWNEFDFIARGYQNAQGLSLWRRFALAANSKDKPELEQLYRQNRSHSSDFPKVIAGLSRAFLHNLTVASANPVPPCTPEETKFLTQYLLMKESWTLEETNLFTSVYFLFEPEAQRMLIDLCYRSLIRYRDYTGYEERIYNLLTNYISHCYLSGSIIEGDRWLERLRELPRNTYFMHQLLNAKLCEALHCAAHGEADQGRRLAEQCAEVFRHLDFEQKADNALQLYEEMFTILDRSFN